MNEFIEASVLGIIQGLTEFLPVSSSGHLEIGKFLLGDDAVGEESLLMTVVLHFATALSTDRDLPQRGHRNPSRPVPVSLQRANSFLAEDHFVHDPRRIRRHRV